jgi:hypothetical protein
MYYVFYISRNWQHEEVWLLIFKNQFGIKYIKRISHLKGRYSFDWCYHCEKSFRIPLPKFFPQSWKKYILVTWEKLWEDSHSEPRQVSRMKYLSTGNTFSSVSHPAKVT